MNSIHQPPSAKAQFPRFGLKLVWLAFALLILRPSDSFAQGTAFTYQGRLTDGGVAANGSYDFTFQIFDAASGGASQGALVTTNGVSVVDGIFTTAMSFGLGPFSSGAPRWLEIGVRTNGGLVFGTIAPRTPLTPAPYAITASNLSGVVPPGGLVGTYPNFLSFSSILNSFTGNGAGLFGLNGANISFGTVGSSQIAPNSVDSSRIIDGSIVNADISASAAIADTKLATIGTAGKVSDSALSANVALLNAGQTFTADKTFGSGAQIFSDSGSATAPGMTFAGDGDTGIFHPLGNTVAVATGGSEQMRVTSAGRVGIGTTNPSRELEVQNSSDVEIGLKSTDTGGRLWTIQSSGINGGTDDASFQVIDRTANGSRLLIRTNGDVGIGTTAPAARLHVAGGTDASLSGGGYIVAGPIAGQNVVIDENEIQARNNGAPSNLYLNYSGPTVNGPLLVIGCSGLVPRVDNNEVCGDLTSAWADVISFRFDNPSDRRLKQNIQPLQYGLQTVLALRPVSYQWKNASDSRVNLGLIAQEVEPIVPEVVSRDENPEHHLALQYNGLIPVLIKAVQEQQALINEQRAQNAELKARLDRLEKLVGETLRQ